MPLEGARAKLGRAYEHFVTLEHELGMPPAPLGAFWKANPDPLEAQIERHGIEHAVYLRLTKEPDLERWGLLLGDGIHNLRCALDLAVYELAIRASGKDPPPLERSLQFPITDDCDKWTGAKWRIGPLSKDAHRVIYDAQPYKTGDDLIVSPLRLLRELDDADKHRLIAPGIFAIPQATVVIHPAVVPLKINVPDREEAVENNTKVAWVLFPKAQPDVRVKFDLTLSIGVTHDPSEYGHTWTPIGDLVADVGNEVFRVIAELERVA